MGLVVLCYFGVINEHERDVLARLWVNLLCKARGGVHMKMLFLIGNAAVGKMTVGQSLMSMTSLRLFHNHMAIEPTIEIMGSYNPTVIARLRDVFFEEFASSDNYGMIFTFMWAFDSRADWDYIERVRNIFTERNPDTEFYYAELVADTEARLARNVTKNRLKHKASKRDIEASTARNISNDSEYRLVSNDGEITFSNYIKIDNTHLSPDEVAKRIKDEFGFE